MPQFTSAGQGPASVGLEASVRRSVRCAANIAVLRELLGFVAIAYAFTWACWLPLHAVRDPLLHRVLETAGQYGPLVGALVMTCLTAGRRGLRQLLAPLVRWRFNPGLAVLALALPPVAYCVAIALYAKWSGVPAQFRSFNLLYDVAINFFLILWGGPLGEEPGWRGFALPRLQAVAHPLVATVILGVAWAAWHCPRWWAAGQFPLRIVGIHILALIGFSVVFTYLYNKSRGSVLPCLMLHASANTFRVILPIERAWTAWTAVIWIVAILIVLRDPRLGRAVPIDYGLFPGAGPAFGRGGETAAGAWSVEIMPVGFALRAPNICSGRVLEGPARMSYYPQYPQQSPYQPDYSTLPVNRRPTAVTVIAIIGIIWAALLLICNGIGLFGVSGVIPNPLMDELKADNPAVWASQIAIPILGFVIAIVLMAGSIGSLKLQNWGRLAMIVYAVIAILIGLANAIITMVFLRPLMNETIANTPNPEAAAMGQQVGFFCGAAIVIAYPICVLIYMNKASIKAAFTGGEMPPAAAGPNPTYPYGGQRPY